MLLVLLQPLLAPTNHNSHDYSSSCWYCYCCCPCYSTTVVTAAASNMTKPSHTGTRRESMQPALTDAENHCVFGILVLYSQAGQGQRVGSKLWTKGTKHGCHNH